MTETDQIMALWRDGFDTQEIAERLGILEFYVHSKIRDDREARLSKASKPTQSFSCRKIFDPITCRWRYRTPSEITKWKTIQGGQHENQNQQIILAGGG